MDIAAAIAASANARKEQVQSVIELLDEGNTVPFIARYRKERTGSLEDFAIRKIEEDLAYFRSLEQRKQTVLESIAAQGKLTDELKAKIEGSVSKTEVEDLYLPFKPKRETKAQKAKAAGLGPLADALLADPALDPEAAAAAFAQPDSPYDDAGKALEGARFILIERLAEDAQLLGAMREKAWAEGFVRSRLRKLEEKGQWAKYGDYFAFDEPIARCPSHRALAMLRARREGAVALSLGFGASISQQLRQSGELGEEAFAALESADKDADKPGIEELENMARALWGLKRVEDAAAGAGAERPRDAFLAKTARLAVKGKMLPAIETDLLERMRENAEKDAAQVFAENLAQVLMAPPAGPKATLGLDPGVRTGVKAALVDAAGAFVLNETLYPFAPRNDVEGAKRALRRLIRDNNVSLIAIGNGTASRETDRLVASVLRDMALEAQGAAKADAADGAAGLSGLSGSAGSAGSAGSGSAKPGRSGLPQSVVVSEAGASVYSASEAGQREFPDLDVTVRGAISIARRLQDPLAELIKIDPKSIGVGQYQHDVDQKKLSESLDKVVEDCVNKVGVNLNTASAALLSRVSGLGKSVAANIVRVREKNGPFLNRRQLLDVPQLGPKAFEQSAGFLRIKGEGAQEPLDASGVHPEAYGVARRMASDLGLAAADLIGNDAVLDKIDKSRYVDERFGMPTVCDIIDELRKPGRDPRAEFEPPAFDPAVNDVADLAEGMELNGVVSNVTAFGAFVDVGAHQDGLVHISKMTKKAYVDDPTKVVKVGMRVRVRVLAVDAARRRVSLELLGRQKGGAVVDLADDPDLDFGALRRKPRRGGANAAIRPARIGGQDGRAPRGAFAEALLSAQEESKAVRSGRLGKGGREGSAQGKGRRGG